MARGGNDDPLAPDERAAPEHEVEQRPVTVAEALERGLLWSDQTSRLLSGSMAAVLEGLRKQQDELSFALAGTAQLSEFARRAAGHQWDPLRSTLAQLPSIPTVASALDQAMRAVRHTGLFWEQHEVLLRQHESRIQGLFKHPALDDAIAAVARTQHGAGLEALTSIRTVLAQDSTWRLPIELNEIVRDLVLSYREYTPAFDEAWEDLRSQVQSIGTEGHVTVEEVSRSSAPADGARARDGDPTPDWRRLRSEAAEISQILSVPVMIIIMVVTLLSQRDNAAEVGRALRAYAEHLGSRSLSHSPKTDSDQVVARDAPVREHPSGKARVQFRVEAGTRVEVLFTSGRWHFVAHVVGGERVAFGWLFGRQLE